VGRQDGKAVYSFVPTEVLNPGPKKQVAINFLENSGPTLFDHIPLSLQWRVKEFMRNVAVKLTK